MQDTEFGRFARNLGVVYKIFMLYRYHVSLRQTILQAVEEGMAAPGRPKNLKILQFFNEINFDEISCKINFKKFNSSMTVF